MFLNTWLIVVALIVVIDTNPRVRAGNKRMSNLKDSMTNLSVTVSGIVDDVKSVVVVINKQNDDSTKALSDSQTALKTSQNALKDAQTALDKALSEEKVDEATAADLQTKLDAATAANADLQTKLDAANSATDLGPSADALDALNDSLKDADKTLKGLIPAASDAGSTTTTPSGPISDPGASQPATTVVTDPNTGTATTVMASPSSGSSPAVDQTQTVAASGTTTTTIPADQSNMSDGDPTKTTGNGSTTTTTVPTDGDSKVVVADPANPDAGTNDLGAPINQDAITNSTNPADETVKKDDGNAPGTNDVLPVGDVSVVNAGDTNEDKSQDAAR